MQKLQTNSLGVGWWCDTLYALKTSLGFPSVKKRREGGDRPRKSIPRLKHNATWNKEIDRDRMNRGGSIQKQLESRWWPIVSPPRKWSSKFVVLFFCALDIYSPFLAAEGNRSQWALPNFVTPPPLPPRWEERKRFFWTKQEGKKKEKKEEGLSELSCSGGFVWCREWCSIQPPTISPKKERKKSQNRLLGKLN